MDPADTDDAAESGWRDDALRDVFQRSLADHLRDEIELRDEPPDLEALITRHAIRQSHSGAKEGECCPDPVIRPLPAHDSETSAADYDTFRESLSLPEPEPMQLGRAHGTSNRGGALPAASVRFLHVLREDGSYPPPLSSASGKRTGSVVMGVYRSSCVPNYVNSRILLKATLSWRNHSLHLSAFVDSGADESFF